MKIIFESTKKERIHPTVLEYGNNGMFNNILKIDHPFLQSLIDMNALVYRDGDGYSVVGNTTFAWFWLHPDNYVTLECIATPAGDRGKGSGSMVMNAICRAADETDTSILIRVTTVEMPGMRIGSVPFAIAHGTTKAGKIPVKDLPKWYKKFGFKMLKKVTGNKNNRGVHMERKPQKDLEVQ